MLTDSPAILTAIADILLAFAALASAGILWRRWGEVLPRRPVAMLLGIFALAFAGRSLAPFGWHTTTAAINLACAVLAWGAVVALLSRCPDVPEVEEDSETTRLLETALSVCGDGVMTLVPAANDDSDGVQIVYSNPAFERLTGYSTDEAVGLSPSVLADEPDGLAAIREAVRGTELVRVELPGRRKDGSRVWAEWHIVPVTDTEGRHTHSVAVLRDVTDRRRAERALRDSEARLPAGCSSRPPMPSSFSTPTNESSTPTGRRCQILGYTHAELTALAACDLDANNDTEQSIGETRTVECAFRRKDGEAMPVEIRYALLDMGGRKLKLAFVRDVTRRRRAEQALREREKLLRDVIAHIPCGVFWKDRESKYLGCNDQVARDHGLTSPNELLGRSDFDLCTQHDEAAFYRDCDKQVIETGQPILNLEEQLTRSDGTRAHC